MTDLNELRREAHAGDNAAAFALLVALVAAGAWLGWIVWLVVR